MISKKQVKHIADLARLSLTEKEISKFQKQLNDTLDYVSILDELDISKVEPTFQITGLKNVFKNDKVYESLPQNQVLSGVDSKKNGYFKTKRILKHKNGLPKANIQGS